MSVEVTTTFTDEEAALILAYLQANQNISLPSVDPGALTVEAFVASYVNTGMFAVNAWAAMQEEMP